MAVTDRGHSARDKGRPSLAAAQAWVHVTAEEARHATGLLIIMKSRVIITKLVKIHYRYQFTIRRRNSICLTCPAA